jgi:bisphosphoglycerate-independent phosphoglycerate mutase (AlkP superfamily)
MATASTIITTADKLQSALEAKKFDAADHIILADLDKKLASAIEDAMKFDSMYSAAQIFVRQAEKTALDASSLATSKWAEIEKLRHIKFVLTLPPEEALKLQESILISQINEKTKSAEPVFAAAEVLRREIVALKGELDAVRIKLQFHCKHQWKRQNNEEVWSCTLCGAHQ